MPYDSEVDEEAYGPDLCQSSQHFQGYRKGKCHTFFAIGKSLIGKFCFKRNALHQETGKNSQENRRNRIKSLLVAAVDCEPQYLVRLAQVIR